MSQSAVNQAAYLLIAAHENGARTEHPMKPGCSMFVGSSDSCGIRLFGKDVAAKHCLVDLNDGVVSIQDWVSPTGTLVNGAAIDSKVAITVSDKVTLGSASITLRPAEVPVPTGEREQASEDSEVVSEDHPETDEYATVHDIDVTGNGEPGGLDQSLDALDAYTEELLNDCDLEDDDDVDAWNGDASQLNEHSAWHALGDDDDDLNDDRSPAVAWDEPLEDSGGDDFGQYDQQTVDLLKAEIDDLRSLLADRDAQIHEIAHEHPTELADCASAADDVADRRLQSRVDELLAEATEHDERIAILHDLLQAGEVKNQAEAEERQALEAWVGEIEHRIGQRESEFSAELDSLKKRAAETAQERDQLQHQLRQVASRFDAADAYQETLDKLQTRNAKLQEQFETARKQCGSLKRHLENLKNRETDPLQEERALIAKERAAVSRMRFELSRKLTDFEEMGEPQNQSDKEAALRLQTLRAHLREIHQQEQEERAQKGESLMTRISSLWKRMDNEY